MRRLYLQVYLAFLLVLGVLGVLMAVTWWLTPFSGAEARTLDAVSGLVAELLPSDRSRPELERSLRRVGGSLDLELSLWSGEGTLLAAVGEPLRFPGSWRTRSGFMHARGQPVGVLRLPDGRWLVVRRLHAGGHSHGIGLLWAASLVAVAVALGAYPLARRLTRRLERLRAGVEELGGGDLHARVPVEGQDEVAALARSFNRAADRIEALLAAQRTLLASASHELRSPLARIRVAVELMGGDRPELGAKVAGDIAELDELIGELLLASRLEAVEPIAPLEELDLLGLVAEEAAAAEAEVEGQPVSVRGDPRLLRRLVRNLVENARRYGGGSRVEAWVGSGDGRARLRICDRGPGVPAEERERIFEPFYRLPGATPREGAGLGLALVRQIARRHGGEARCLPRDGGGSCFEVDLPLASG